MSDFDDPLSLNLDFEHAEVDRLLGLEIDKAADEDRMTEAERWDD